MQEMDGMGMTNLNLNLGLLLLLLLGPAHLVLGHLWRRHLGCCCEPSLEIEWIFKGRVASKTGRDSGRAGKAGCGLWPPVQRVVMFGGDARDQWLDLIDMMRAPSKSLRRQAELRSRCGWPGAATSWRHAWQNEGCGAAVPL
jgi:hypothetical protein